MNQRNFTKGSIPRAILTLLIPIMFANILFTIYNLTDTFWVGQLGSEAVASVALAFPVLFFLMSLAGGLSFGGEALIAQYKGREDKKNINYFTGQTFILVLIIAFFISIIGFLITPFLVNLLTKDPLVVGGAISYLRISFMGMIPVFIFYLFSGALRGIGEVKFPMFIVLGTVLLNFILDPLFINGFGFIPAFGVGGAAIATIGTQSIAGLIGIFILLNGYHELKLKLKHLKPNLNAFKKIFKIGFPNSIEQSSRAISMFFIMALVASFGTAVLAAYGLGGRIYGFIMVPAIAFSMATAAVVGQNMGVKNITRAKDTVKKAGLLSAVSLFLAGIVLFIFATPISAVFVPGEFEVIAMSASFIRMFSLGLGFLGAEMVIIGALRGSGNTNLSMILSIISSFLLFIVAYILAKMTLLGYKGIFISFPIVMALSLLIAGIIYFKSGWTKKEIIQH